jgi:hypothetical protein
MKPYRAIRAWCARVAGRKAHVGIDTVPPPPWSDVF